MKRELSPSQHCEGYHNIGLPVVTLNGRKVGLVEPGWRIVEASGEHVWITTSELESAGVFDKPARGGMRGGFLSGNLGDRGVPDYGLSGGRRPEQGGGGVLASMVEEGRGENVDSSSECGAEGAYPLLQRLSAANTPRYAQQGAGYGYPDQGVPPHDQGGYEGGYGQHAVTSAPPPSFAMTRAQGAHGEGRSGQWGGAGAGASLSNSSGLDVPWNTHFGGEGFQGKDPEHFGAGGGDVEKTKNSEKPQVRTGTGTGSRAHEIRRCGHCREIGT